MFALRPRANNRRLGEPSQRNDRLQRRWIRTKISRLTAGFGREDEKVEEWNPLKTPLSPHSEVDC